MTATTPRIQGNILIYQHSGQLAHVLVDTSDWFAWLNTASTFLYRSELGAFTARKERAGSKRGGEYWKAYRKRQGKLYRVYLGKSEDLTLEHLQSAAEILACKGEEADSPEVHVPVEGARQSFETSSGMRTGLGRVQAVSSPSELGLSKPWLASLPIPPRALIGREQEVQTICELLSRPEVRLLTIIGTGGVGKTRLAMEIAHVVRADFPDGICFVPLALVSDHSRVMAAIAQELGLWESAELPPEKQVYAVLRDRHLMLLLDNFEQVVRAALQVVELLAACPRLKVLVTSRVVLHVQAEYEFPVPPLALPSLAQLPAPEALAQYAAVALFLERARTFKPTFQLTSAKARTIAEICVHLDGLPLAIELAAARIKLLPAQALLARLSQRLAVLTSGAKDAPVRQQTLRNTIAWSYDLLDAAEQRLFRCLCVFVGGCTLEAVEAVCMASDESNAAGAVLDGVSSLIDKSLLQPIEQAEEKGEEPRFAVLETIREYGLEALEASGEMEATRQAHALYYLRLAEQAEPELRGPQQAVWLERLEREHDNLRAAMQWSLEPGEAGHSMETALHFGGSLALLRLWQVHGPLSEGRSFLERTLARSEGAAVAERAKALEAAANLAGFQDDTDRAEALFEGSLSLYRELEDKRGMAAALFWLGSRIAGQRNDLARARMLISEALALQREVGDKEGAAWSFFGLAALASVLGGYANARALYEEALSMHRQLGNKHGAAWSLFRLAEVIFVSQGDPAKVHSLLEESLALFRELADKDGFASSFQLLGRLALSQGDAAVARSWLEESARIYRELGFRQWTAESLSLLARAEARLGAHARAHELSEEGLALAQEVGERSTIAFTMEGLAGVVLKGDPKWAARLLSAAQFLRMTNGTPIPPVERADYERWVATARTQLGQAAFATAWAEGRTMTLEQALASPGPVAVPEEGASSAQPTPAKTLPTYPAGLTAREVELLRLVAQGLTDAQVAEQLIISPRTVNWHLTSIYSKIGVSSRAAATRYAIEQKLL